MGVCTVKEHLVLPGDQGDFGLRQLLRQRLLAFSMSLMPRNNVLRCELALRADRKLYAFTGTLATPEYYSLVQAVKEGADLEFIGFYEYRWESWWQESRFADPYGLAQSFLRLDCSCLQNLFYSLYTADCGDPGEVLAFGRKNGRCYHGVVPYVPSDQLPRQGRWYSPVTAVAYRTGSLRDVDVSRLMPVCRSLCALGGQNELKIDWRGFFFSLSQPELHGAEELCDYAALCRELWKLTGGKCTLQGEFVELSTPDPRMVLLDFQNLDTPRMTLL